MHVFDQTGQFILSHCVFPAQRIYGIAQNSRNKLAVHGANKVKIIAFDFARTEFTKSVVYREFDDWILDLKWINLDQSIVTVFANNYVSSWLSFDLTNVQNVCCSERCLLYSANVVNDTWDDVYILSGTVFSEILVWKPSGDPFFCPVLCRLKGHDVSFINFCVSSLEIRIFKLKLWSELIFVIFLAPILNLH